MRISIWTSLLFGSALTACGTSSPSDGDRPSIPQGYGRVSVALTGSGGGSGQGMPNAMGGHKGEPLDQAIVVIDKVTVHSDGGWITLRDSVQVTVDVLRLGDSAVDLGFADLPAGKVGQIRLHVDPAHPPFVVTTAGSEIPLKVPSGSQSGLKIKGNWDVEGCANTTVTLELQHKKAIWIHPTGHEDLYILRPTIKAGGTITGDECEPDPNDPDGDHPDGDDPNTPDGEGPSGDPDPSGSPDPGGSSDPTDPNDPGTGEDPTGGDPTGGDPTGGDSGDPTDGEPLPTTPPNVGCGTSADCGIDSYCTESGVCTQF